MFRVLYVSDLTWKFLSVGQAILALFLIYATLYALATLFVRIEDDDGWISGSQETPAADKGPWFPIEETGVPVAEAARTAQAADPVEAPREQQIDGPVEAAETAPGPEPLEIIENEAPAEAAETNSSRETGTAAPVPGTAAPIEETAICLSGEAGSDDATQPPPSGNDFISPVPVLSDASGPSPVEIPHFRRVDHPSEEIAPAVPENGVETDGLTAGTGPVEQVSMETAATEQVVAEPASMEPASPEPVLAAPPSMVPASEEASPAELPAPAPDIQWKGVEGMVFAIDSLGEKLSKLNVNTLRNVMSLLPLVGDRRERRELLARATTEVEELAEMVAKGPLPAGFSRKAISSLAEVARAIDVRNFKAALDILEGLHDSIMDLFYPGG